MPNGTIITNWNEISCRPSTAYWAWDKGRSTIFQTRTWKTAAVHLRTTNVVDGTDERLDGEQRRQSSTVYDNHSWKHGRWSMVMDDSVVWVSTTDLLRRINSSVCGHTPSVGEEDCYRQPIRVHSPSLSSVFLFSLSLCPFFNLCSLSRFICIYWREIFIRIDIWERSSIDEFVSPLFHPNTWAAHSPAVPTPPQTANVAWDCQPRPCRNFHESGDKKDWV